MTEETTLADSAEGESSETETTATKAETEQADKKADAKADSDATAEPKSDDTSKQESDQSATEKPKRKSRYQDRISELTGRAKSAEREAIAEKARADRLDGRLKSYEGTQPKEGDFETHEEFQAALTAHQVRQVQKEDRETDAKDARSHAETKEQDALRIAYEAFDERAAEFAENTPDYHESVSDQSLNISKETSLQLLRSDRGPQVAYFLSKNRRDAARLAGLTNPTDVAREIGRIEGRLTAPSPKRVTSAPDPVKAVAKGSGSEASFNPAKASVDDYEAHLKRTGVL